MTLMLQASDDVQGSPQMVGGKAYNLAWLLRHRFPVPPFIVLSCELFQQILLQQDKLSWFQSHLETISNPDCDPKTIKDLQQGILELSWSEAFSQQLVEALNQAGISLALGCGVRSSVTDEDASHASFAGQMDSFLFQHTLEDIQQSYLKVMASMVSERAIKYRQSQGLTIKSIAGAAIVQQMVNADVSGVTFTVHPSSGSRSTMLISACYGLGEGLVSGLCNGDEFTVPAVGDKVDTTIASKDIKLVWDQDQGRGLRQIPVPQQQQMQACLNPAQVIQIRDLCYRVSQEKAQPQDIEWCIKDGEIILLQTRPITHLPPPRQPQGQRVVWDNSNIQESYCGVTSPLTFSFANRAYRSVYTQTLRILGTPEHILRSQEKNRSNMLGLIRGRIYYNINNWYQCLSMLPSFKTNKEDMEKMMGLQDPVDFIEDKVLSPWQKFVKLPRMFLLLLSFRRSFAKMDVLVAQFLQRFGQYYQKIDRGNLHRLELSELFKLAEDLTDNLLGQWHTPIINDFFVMMMNGKVGRHLKRAGFASPDLLQNNLMSGEEGVESTEPTKYLMDLAEKIRGDQQLMELFDSYQDQQLWEQARCKAPDFFKDCQHYVDLYGDRCMGELKLESISLRQDPSFMFSVLRNFLGHDHLKRRELEDRERKLRFDTEKEVFASLKQRRGRWGLWVFKRDLMKLRKAVKFRENMRFSRTRAFGLFRDIYSEMGRQLHFYGLLNDPRDVFYLTVEELEAYHDGRSVQTDLKSLTAVRQQEWADYHQEDLPHHFSTWGAVYHHNQYKYEGAAEGVSIPADGVLKGTPCYPGTVVQAVRKIFSPQDELDLGGRILCTVRTDPGWTPLFPSASGILVERGSTLSHSAVIARELGIPAIVGIPGLTAALTNDQIVCMSGSDGTIRMEGESHHGEL